MWLVVARPPAPDAPHWPGRRLLACFDAVVWPTLFVAAVLAFPFNTGIVGPFFMGLALLVGARRLHRAFLLNHRYRFTTWRWGKVAVAMLVMGMVLKFSLAA